MTAYSQEYTLHGGMGLPHVTDFHFPGVFTFPKQGHLAYNQAVDYQSKHRGMLEQYTSWSTPTTLSLPRTHSTSSHISADTVESGSEPSSPSSASPSNDKSGNIVIRPRRRAGTNDKDLEPITITIEVLESLYSKQLSVAAKTLGISVTALKKVCRNLGVRNWPYRFQGFMARPAREVEDDAPADRPALAPVTSAPQAPPPSFSTAPSTVTEDDLDVAAMLKMSRNMWGQEEPKIDMETVLAGENGWLVCPVDASSAGL